MKIIIEEKKTITKEVEITPKLVVKQGFNYGKIMNWLNEQDKEFIINFLDKCLELDRYVLDSINSYSLHYYRLDNLFEVLLKYYKSKGEWYKFIGLFYNWDRREHIADRYDKEYTPEKELQKFINDDDIDWLFDNIEESEERYDQYEKKSHTYTEYNDDIVKFLFNELMPILNKLQIINLIEMCKKLFPQLKIYNFYECELKSVHDYDDYY